MYLVNGHEADRQASDVGSKKTKCCDSLSGLPIHEAAASYQRWCIRKVRESNRTGHPSQLSAINLVEKPSIDRLGSTAIEAVVYLQHHWLFPRHVVFVGAAAVSYTHLTLPTNREV